MKANLYYNCLLKQVKQVFSCRSLHIHLFNIYLFISCYISKSLLYSFLNIKGANRLGGETTSGSETTRGETTRGETSWGRND